MAVAIVTGASSFIGKALCKSLSEDGVEVVACIHKKEVDAPHDHFAYIDLLNKERTYYAIEHALSYTSQTDITFYHVASLGSSTDDFKAIPPLEYLNKSNEMNANAYLISKELACKDFVFVSSIGSLEPRFNVPGEAYDLSKRNMDFYIAGDKRARSVYLPSVFGPDMDIEKSRLIPNIVKGAEKDETFRPEKIHDVCHVNEAVKMIKHETGKIYKLELGLLWKKVEYLSTAEHPGCYDDIDHDLYPTVMAIKRRAA